MKSIHFAENFHKAVIYHIHGTVVPVDVPENYLQAVAVVPLVKIFLIGLVVLNTTSNYFVKEFQSRGLFSGGT